MRKPQIKFHKTAVNQVLVILIWLIIIITGLAVFINVNSKAIEKTSILINEAGKIRGGTQRITKLYLDGKTVNAHLPDIEESINMILVYSRSANPLYGSYNVQYLDATRKNWEGLIHLIEEEAPREQILEQSEILWYSSNALVNSIEEQTVVSTERFKVVATAFFSVVLALLLVLFITKYVIKDKIEYGATHDLLTGLYNRYYFQDALEREYAVFKRTGKKFALLMCDIDYFKKINDTLGHSTGDRILREMGNLLRSETRSVDTAVRYGGEEFAILMTAATTPECTAYAERIRNSVAKHRFRGNIPVTISIGFCIQHPGLESAKLIANADKALYRAKEAGRNCVVDFDSQNS